MATLYLDQFRESIANLIQDTAHVLGPGVVREQAKLGLSDYSRDGPDEDVVEFVGDGGKYYPISNLTNWSDGFSKIRAIEYPAATVASDEQPQMLETGDYTIFEDATAKYIYFPNHSPAATESIRVWYSLAYVFSGSPYSTAIPSEDFFAICQLAAAKCCTVLKAHYSTFVDIDDGVVNVKRSQASKKYGELAEEYERAYKVHMNLPLGDKPKAAGVIAEWDVRPHGREYIFHGSKTR